MPWVLLQTFSSQGILLPGALWIPSLSWTGAPDCASQACNPKARQSHKQKQVGTSKTDLKDSAIPMSAFLELSSLLLFACFALQHISAWKQTAQRSLIPSLLLLCCYLRAEGLALQPHTACHTSVNWCSNSFLWFMAATDTRSGSCTKI